MAFTSAQEQALASLEATLSYKFKNPILGLGALTITQPLSPNPADAHEFENLNYENLEFLGDSVLDVCTKIALLQQGHAISSNLKMFATSLVTNDFLAGIALHMGLHKLLLKPNGQADTSLFQPRKRLADIVEAILGAVVVDSKLDFTDAQIIYERFIFVHKANPQMQEKNTVLLQGWPTRTPMPNQKDGTFYLDALFRLAQKHNQYLIVSNTAAPSSNSPHGYFGKHPFYISWNGEYLMSMGLYFRDTPLQKQKSSRALETAAWSMLEYLRIEHGIT